MAAAEYYFGTQAAQQQNRPYPFPQPQPQFQFQQQQGAPPAQTVALQNHAPPPPYSQFPQPPRPSQGYPAQPQQQPYPSNGRPPTSAPYPTTPPSGPQRWPSGPQPQASGYLGVPLQPQRSHSQPPRVRFADDKYDSDDSALYSGSDSDASRRRRHRRHHRHRSHSGRDRSRSRGGDSDGDYDRDYERERRERVHRKEHKDRDTFLGAGGGAILGDVIFPGLGTAAGLLLGGYGGRKHASKRSQSEAAADREGWHHSRHNANSGWDAESGTFKKGWAVR